MKSPFHNILLIDKNEDTYKNINKLLDESRLKFELGWCQNYNEGVNELKKGSHDVYLINYEMDGFSGVDLILESKRTFRTRLIIILSDISNEDWETNSIETGASDYLEKSELTSLILERSIRYARGRNRSHQLIKEERRKYRTLFKLSLDPIVLCNLSFEVLEYNDSFVDLVGKDVTESKSIQLNQLILENDVLTRFKNTITKTTTFKDYEIQISSAYGILDCLINVSPIKKETGEMEGYQVIIHDVTKLKRDAKSANTKERINYTGKLAKLIAHEVRNPLTNINLAASQLKEIKNPEPEERSLYFDIIERNSTRINELISQWLDSSKPSILNKEPYTFDKIIQNAVQLCSDRIKLHNVDLKLNVAEQEKIVHVDHEKLEIAFLNIMTNALEAMLEKESPQLAINLNYSAGFAIISIQDNGKGMSEEQLERVFEPFFTNRRGGKGLGMTLSQNIIGSHNGEIEIISKINEGTSFIITIPV